MPLMRTEYWNRSTGTVRAGSTDRGESLTDVESYLLPVDQVRNSALHRWGVAAGLTVNAVSGRPGVAVLPGMALDAAGHVVVLEAGGLAVVDPDVDPNQMQSVPTVVAGTDGLGLSTAGLTGEFFLTLRWREIQQEGPLGNAPVLVHAPWLRLLSTATFQDTGEQVVLARVTLAAGGTVTGVSAEGRRMVGVPAGRLELRCPRVATGPALRVDHVAAVELRARADGGLDVNVLSPVGGAPRPALSVEGLTGNVVVASGLKLRNAAGGAKVYGISSGSDGSWHFTDADAQVDRVVIDQTGNVGVGLGTSQAQRVLQVEGSEVHSGGAGGGFSFTDRNVAEFVNHPSVGERWVWYALDGSARLWSGRDLLSISPGTEGGGLDVARRMRVRQGADSSAGVWFFQSGPKGDRAFVGMADDNHVGFWGNTGAGWGLRMNTSNRNLLFGGDYGRPDGPSTLSLFGARIGDVGGGVLFIRSGGSVVTFDGGDKVGIGTARPRGSLDVSGPETAIFARGGTGRLQAGIRATGSLGVWADGSASGIMATGGNSAGTFFGDVTITGTLWKGGGGFKIDHPLDPANKYLSHSFVESPEMLNIYSGNIVTDDRGEATVTLPEFFEALNRDYRYQATPIGEMAHAVVMREVRDSSFTIRTDKPGVTVSWLVTGVRKDPWANANRIDVEEAKPDVERDLFLHPEAHEQPADRNVLGLLTDDK